MAKISSAGHRFPPPVGGIQANFCKNPRCANFGVPETLHRKRRAPGARPEPGHYTLAAMGAGQPLMKCGLCGEHLPIRSNLALSEEVQRLLRYTEPHPGPTCPNSDCPNHRLPSALANEPYVHNGKTKAGTPRWRCQACKKTFSAGGKSTNRQRMSHKNRDVFVLLINKSPINRIVEVTGLSKQTVYDKIEFIHRQCLAFAGGRERHLSELELPKMYVAVDRQAFIVNWTSRKDRRNVKLNAIASADLRTGYVFGMHLNFDGTLNPLEIERDAEDIGDHVLPEPYRRYARLWLKSDYLDALQAGNSSAAKRAALKVAKAGGADELNAEITAEYAAGAAKADIEQGDEQSQIVALPKLGMQIHEQYTLYAHYLVLARLLQNAPKVRLFLDQDSGFRAGFMAAFHERVRARTADAWYVKVLTESTIDEKDKAVLVAKKRLAAYEDANPGLSPFDIQVLMVKDEMARMKSIGHWGDKWLVHPVASRTEPDKRICWLTDLGDYDDDHAARLYLKASLRAVDRFFMQARRRLSLAERPYTSANSTGRMWYGYSAYRPQNLAMVLDIFRVCYNFHLVGRDKKTPAMRLGLARAPVELEDILYFQAPPTP